MRHFNCCGKINWSGIIAADATLSCFLSFCFGGNNIACLVRLVTFFDVSVTGVVFGNFEIVPIVLVLLTWPWRIVWTGWFRIRSILSSVFWICLWLSSIICKKHRKISAGPVNSPETWCWVRKNFEKGDHENYNGSFWWACEQWNGIPRSSGHPNFISSTFIISLKRSKMFNPIELEATITPVLLPISIFLCNESEPKVLHVASRTVLLCCKYISRRRDSGSERKKSEGWGFRLNPSFSLERTGSFQKIGSWKGDSEIGYM